VESAEVEFKENSNHQADLETSSPLAGPGVLAGLGGFRCEDGIFALRIRLQEMINQYKKSI